MPTDQELGTMGKNWLQTPEQSTGKCHRCGRISGQGCDDPRHGPCEVHGNVCLHCMDSECIGQCDIVSAVEVAWCKVCGWNDGPGMPIV